MDLLLWRHAEAEDGDDDFARALTGRGEKQAKAVARWLRQHLPRHLRIVASPTVRTRQTAEALDLPFEIERRIGPGAQPADLLAAAGWPSARGAVLLVGHQPGLGQLASLLLAGQESEWTIKKGALWWLTRRIREGEPQTVLRTVVSPDFLAGSK
ncbi:SixA phosphatase family protein [Azospira restricta]|uniref:Histidine phosphatase family protein n=1 Tax=Azospira restricta TaxID=404405 RepID=A0A974Y3A2_9RHOO|nr:histidine phosphatase family protein [Azospira restricta]QRJ63798.1 histidine phosphatase family protein [Azospira restricta]